MPTISAEFNEEILSYIETNTDGLTGHGDTRWFCSYYLLGADEHRLYLYVMKPSVIAGQKVDQAVVLPLYLKLDQDSKITGCEWAPDGADYSKFTKALPKEIRENLYKIVSNASTPQLEEALLLRAKSVQ